MILHVHYEKMLILKVKGWNYAQIGREFSLSRERVRQIFRNPWTSQRKDHAHGTTDKYRNGCRCKKCREQWEQYQQEQWEQYQQERREQYKSQILGPSYNHGTISCYFKGCRCDKCRVAYASYQRAAYQRRKRFKIADAEPGA